MMTPVQRGPVIAGVVWRSAGRGEKRKGKIARER